RSKLIGERPRRVVLEAGGCEQSRRALLRARAHSSTEYDRYLLAAALDGDAPLPSAGAYDAIEIGGFRDLLVIDRDHDVALLETDRLRRRAVGNADDDDAFALRIEPQLVGERRRKVGDGGPAERRTRADLHFVARRFGNALQRDRDHHLAALPDETDLRGAAQRLGSKAVIEGVRIVDRRAV